MNQQIDYPDSPVKRALIHGELVERIAELQPKASRYETHLNDRGAYILIFPHHHRVSAYAYELASVNARREYDGDLRTARRRLKKATLNYENRVNWRGVPDMPWPNQQEGERFVCLASILEARAEAVYWRKIVKEAEHIARIKRNNRWAVARSHVTPI